MNRIALGLLLALGCRSTERPAAPVATGCVPAHLPTDVVVEVERSTLPMAGKSVNERGAVTQGGVCPTKIACAKIDGATMSAIWADLAKAATIEHGPASSPHYGGRWLEATWSGGSCTISDSSETPVTQASRPLFDAAFDAVVRAVSP